MTKRKIDLRYIQQEDLRQATFAKRKQSLMRKAMELAVMCNAQVALVMFDDKGKLSQFSTNDMDIILEQYGKAVLEPHERYTPHDLLYGSVYANGFGVGPMAHAASLVRAAQGGAGPSGSPGESPSGVSEACQAMIGTQQLLGPLGLSIDTSAFPPVSPRSEQAYNAIAGEFERMMAVMQQQQQQQMQQLQKQQERDQEGNGKATGGRPKSAHTPSSSMPPPASRKPQVPAGLAAADDVGAAAGALLDAVAAAGEPEAAHIDDTVAGEGELAAPETMQQEQQPEQQEQQLEPHEQQQPAVPVEQLPAVVATTQQVVVEAGAAGQPDEVMEPGPVTMSPEAAVPVDDGGGQAAPVAAPVEGSAERAGRGASGRNVSGQKRTRRGGDGDA